MIFRMSERRTERELRSNALHTGIPVKPLIEAHDLLDLMTLHHGDVERVPGRQAYGSVHDFFGTLNIRCLYWKDLVNHSRQRIEGRLNGVASLDGYVAVENLLQYLGIRHQTHSVDDVTFQHALCVGLVGVRSPHQIHRDGGIDKYGG